MKAKTLVIQPLQGIGDYMWFVPHLHALAVATPEKKISLLTRPRSFADQLSEHDTLIDEVLWLNVKKGPHDGVRGLIRLARMLRTKKYDQVYILHSRSLRYPIACRLAGIPKVYGPGIGWQRWFLTNPKTFLSAKNQKKHPIERGTLVLKNHRLNLNDSFFKLYLGDTAEKEAKSFLSQIKGPYIALCIGSSEATKKWPAAHFIHLAEKIYQKKKTTFLIVGGPSETVEGKNIEMALRHKKIPCAFVCGDLRRTLAILKYAQCVIGNDTGVTHASPLLGVQGLVLLGESQVPIHSYTKLEGVKVGADNQMTSPNNIQKIAPERVSERLDALGWI